jgi:hypothetical protein
VKLLQQGCCRHDGLENGGLNDLNVKIKVSYEATTAFVAFKVSDQQKSRYNFD